MAQASNGWQPTDFKARLGYINLVSEINAVRSALRPPLHLSKQEAAAGQLGVQGQLGSTAGPVSEQVELVRWLSG